MFLIVLCLFLGVAMIYLGYSQNKSSCFVYGFILIFCAFLWIYKALVTKRQTILQDAKAQKKDNQDKDL